MSWRYILGWFLVVAAFGSAILEMAARGVGAGGGWIISTHDVWSGLWPQGFAHLRAAVESLPLPGLWDPLLTALMSLPGWLLFGAPGGVLIWRYHPLRGQGGEIDEDSYFLYDRLSKRAREEGEGDDAPLPSAPPPRFADYAEAGDDRDEDILPGPFRSLDMPGQEGDDEEPPAPDREEPKP